MIAIFLLVMLFTTVGVSGSARSDRLMGDTMIFSECLREKTRLECMAMAKMSGLRLTRDQMDSISARP